MSITEHSRPAWKDVKSMMGMQSKNCSISLNGKSVFVLLNELNTSYNHFNVQNFNEELSVCQMLLLFLRRTVFM